MIYVSLRTHAYLFFCATRHRYQKPPSVRASELVVHIQTSNEFEQGSRWLYSAAHSIPSQASHRRFADAASGQDVAAESTSGAASSRHLQGGQQRRDGRDGGRSSQVSPATINMQHRLQNLVAKYRYQEVAVETVAYAEAALEELKANGATELKLDRTILHQYKGAENAVMNLLPPFSATQTLQPSQIKLAKDVKLRVKFIIHQLHNPIVPTFDSHTLSRIARDLFRCAFNACFCMFSHSLENVYIP